jgi:hypothetical protein
MYIEPDVQRLSEKGGSKESSMQWNIHAGPERGSSLSLPAGLLTSLFDGLSDSPSLQMYFLESLGS